MIANWSECRNILCIRADNMGDLLMSSPAIRALKETFQSNITVLTSSMAEGIASYLPEIDEVISYDLPWVKSGSVMETEGFFAALDDIKNRQFDAAVIFTVFSQNPLPAAMLAYLAKIPKRLAYCRENPYELLTNWVPDKEPYTFIRHQVRRDLDLVASVGAFVHDEKLLLKLPPNRVQVITKLENAGVDINKPWLILHAGVSEKKREYPEELWIETGRKIINSLNHQILLTGSKAEKSITDRLKMEMGKAAFSLAGVCSLEEFMLLIQHAPLVISVNTATIHIAAATSTPVIVLYALTNPQHLPWKVAGRVLLFEIPENLKSKNEVLRYVYDHLLIPQSAMASPDEIVNAAEELLNRKGYDSNEYIPEMIPLKKIPG